MSLKTLLRDWGEADSIPRRAAHDLAKALWRTWQFANIPEIRWQRTTAWIHSDRYFQRSTFTAPNRYPDLFEACRQHLAPIAFPRILSFGCSTGDELLSLAEFMPHATLIGVDINPWCLKQSRKKCRGDKFKFFLRTHSDFDEIRDLDAILCLAVFQRTENRNNPENSRATGIRFEQFECEIEILDSKLKPGGLFVVDHADFSFADTRCSRHYETLNFDGNQVHRSRPLFDRKNKKVAEEQLIHRAFVKRRYQGE